MSKGYTNEQVSNITVGATGLDFISSADTLPIEKVCENTNCIKYGNRIRVNNSNLGIRAQGPRYCDFCGSELSTCTADMYIDLLFDRDDLSENIKVPDRGTDPFLQEKQKRRRVSIREFIHILKKYEEEMFVEKI